MRNGKRGLTATIKVTIGTAKFGSRISKELSMQILEKLLSLGVKSIDTADTYGAGHSEKIIAQTLNTNKYDGVSVITKYGLANNTQRLPYFILDLGRRLMKYKILQMLRKKTLNNKKNVVSKEGLYNFILSRQLIFGKFLRGVCLHDLHFEEVRQIIVGNSQLDKLRWETDIELGVSINDTNSEILFNPDVLSKLDFINIDCDIFLRTDFSFKKVIRVYSVYKTARKYSMSGKVVPAPKMMKFLKKVQNKGLQMSADTFVILDCSSDTKIKYWQAAELF